MGKQVSDLTPKDNPAEFADGAKDGRSLSR
jgi:hypothetical protein